MKEENVLASDVMAYLACGLEKRLGLDIADGAADLGDHHVRGLPLGVGLVHREDAALDLVGDVRNHLNGVAEVLTAAFLRYHRGVDLPGGHVRAAGEVPVEESFVVSEVEVGFRAVLGDEHLAVLERIHRARIDVEVRIELLHRDAKTAGGEECPEARGRQALTQGGRNAACNENVLGALPGSGAIYRQCDSPCLGIQAAGRTGDFGRASHGASEYHAPPAASQTKQRAARRILLSPSGRASLHPTLRTYCSSPCTHIAKVFHCSTNQEMTAVV